MGEVSVKTSKVAKTAASEAAWHPVSPVRGRASCVSCQNGRALKLPQTCKKLGAALSVAVGTALVVNPGTASAWFLSPEPAGTAGAKSANTLYWIVLVVAIVAAVAINLTLLRALRTRQARRGDRPAPEPSQGPGQKRVAGLLAGLAVILLVLGVIFTEKSTQVEAANGDPIRIKVTGQQWLWRYDYPNEAYSYYRLTVPVNREIVLDVVSTDVVHSWNVPGLAGKADAVPGKLNQVRFTPTREGIYRGASSVLSGQAYAAMRAEVAVVSEQEYENFIEQRLADTKAAQAAAAKSYKERQAEE